ncbi:MAG: undecaprenyl/decaprenyl-phosphate alpha-N-acetylglucosaminyl 1-phosphate transferase [Aeriscardovia sp.]|nr:undecaprenyl/decaprenyl-phosphate alpha-N-acetylglucosaminyl 1-phosphate transferase [Aeriscardovia sp.]
MRVYLFIALIAAVVTFIATPPIRLLAIKVGAIGQIRARDMHTTPTPRMGGVAMLIGFAVALCFARSAPWISRVFPRSDNQSWIILAGAAMICALGVCDDIWDLDWMLKMSGQILIAVFVSWKGVQIVSLPWGTTLITASPSLSMAITALLIVTSINAVNFVDGLDGLAAGIVAIGGLAFATYSYILSRSQPSFASMATLLDVILVGVCIGFLIHNWHPASIFMGDSGSMLLGYLVTCASVVLTGHFDPSTMHSGVAMPAFMPILLPILVLFIPVLDMCMAIIRRTSHGQSPMHPDRMHLHHRMIRIGHTVRGAVLIMWGWAFVIAFSSIMTLFYTASVIITMLCILVPILSALTLAPHYRQRLREIRQENLLAQQQKGEHKND